MRRHRVTLPALALFAGALSLGAIAACSSDDEGGSATLTPVPQEAGARDAAVDAIIDPDTTDAGPFAVVDEPDTTCDPAVATKTSLFAAATNRAIGELGTVGARHVALRDDGAVTFDATGGSPSAPIGADTVASTGTAFAIAGIDNDGIFYSRHDATGAYLAPAARLELEAVVFNVFSGGGGGGALVAWAGPYGVRARALDANGVPAAPSFRVGGVAETVALTGSITSDGPNGFAVVWSGRADNRWRTAFARTSFADRTSGVNLELSETPRRIVQLQKRAGGFAILMQYGADDAAHLVLVDDKGALVGSAKRLVGTKGGLGLAARDGQLGVLALRPETTDGGTAYRVAFRPFDQSGAPQGGWVCLTDADPSLDAPTGSIVGTAAGYTAVYRDATNAIVHATFGSLGK